MNMTYELSAQTRDKTVLVVDDDDMVRRSVTDVLSTYGMKVRQAANGKTCLEQLRSDLPDLVLIDLIMPEMDGIETIIALRQEWPDLKVLAMSGGGRTRKLDLLSAAGRCGATAALAKPFEPRDLLAHVASVLNDQIVQKH